MTEDLTGTGERPRVAGKYFEVAGRRFEPRGVTYGTFAPGTHGHPFPEMEQVWRDLESIAAAGFNCIRTYTVPPLWLLDAAESTGLRVLAGIPWEQHVVVLEEPGHAARVRASVAEQVSHCSGHPALFAVSIGNEIPTDIVRWSGRERMEGFLERLYEAAKEADPGGLTTYVNYPSTEYLRLPFLDFHAFNVYLESTPDLSGYVARLHNQVGDLPLVMAELGLDASHHGEDRQAYVLQDQTRAVMRAGCAGLFVFSWTDEWFRGGRPVTGWSFGLTSEGREPKPALEAVRGSLAQHPDPPAGGWPSATIVVCAYQAASTITECLEGLARLDYPDFEVLLIDDGSTDDTAGIAEATVARLAESGGPELPLRIVRTANRGLSRARNLGMDEARGEIIAFLDSDAWPDEQWLRQLAYTFASEEHACVGGPNISPPGRGHVAACVGMAPGGPVHVLETDRLAEHVPGCNMAFRAEALRAVGGFDPQFRVAGDDVDLCWRVQNRGWTVGFSAGAMVWHHPRGSVGAYWRQQVGYGEAEGLLEAKWPEKYNAIGHATWGGRVYGHGRITIPWTRGRIYAGTWGRAPFQRAEIEPPSLLWEASAMPEWYLMAALLGGVALMGLVWPPLIASVPLFVAALGIPIVRSVRAALATRFPSERLAFHESICRRGLCAILHLIQPLARLRGRLRHGLVPWRDRARIGRFVLPRIQRLSFWREQGLPGPEVLRRLEFHLRRSGIPVRRDSGWDDWDLEVEGGAGGRARLRSCVEWHGEGRQLQRFAIVPRVGGPAVTIVAVVAILAALAAFDGAPAMALILTAITGVLCLRVARDCGAAGAALSEGLTATFELSDEESRSPVEPDAEPVRPPEPVSGAPSAVDAGRRRPAFQAIG